MKDNKPESGNKPVDDEALIDEIWKKLPLCPEKDETARSKAIEIIAAVRQNDSRDAPSGLVSLRPMSEAPHDIEILAYHSAGKNYHQVKWTDHTWMDCGTEHWGMRWAEDYRQYDCDYDGWQPLPPTP